MSPLPNCENLQGSSTALDVIQTECVCIECRWIPKHTQDYNSKLLSRTQPWLWFNEESRDTPVHSCNECKQRPIKLQSAQ